MWKVYEKNARKESAIHKWISNFKGGQGDVEDESPSGRPSISVCEGKKSYSCPSWRKPVINSRNKNQYGRNLSWFSLHYFHPKIKEKQQFCLMGTKTAVLGSNADKILSWGISLKNSKERWNMVLSVQSWWQSRAKATLPGKGGPVLSFGMFIAFCLVIFPADQTKGMTVCCEGFFDEDSQSFNRKKCPGENSSMTVLLILLIIKGNFARMLVKSHLEIHLWSSGLTFYNFFLVLTLKNMFKSHLFKKN